MNEETKCLVKPNAWNCCDGTLKASLQNQWTAIIHSANGHRRSAKALEVSELCIAVVDIGEEDINAISEKLQAIKAKITLHSIQWGKNREDINGLEVTLFDQEFGKFIRQLLNSRMRKQTCAEVDRFSIDYFDFIGFECA